MRVEGDYNTADVKADEGEDEAIEQIQSMMDSAAFEGDEDVAIMPDFHWGKGSVIGFTMPFKHRVAPATVGVDIGCGMTAIRLPGYADLHDWDHRAILDRAVRERVPTGFNVHPHDADNYHMYEDFPYEVCQEKLETFNENWMGPAISHKYDTDYYDDLVERIGYDPGRVSNSVGTLGGGNHFIEIGEDPEADEHPYWAVIHSGSRGFGAKIADYWIQRAGEIRNAKDVRDYFRHEVPAEYLNFVKFNVESVSDEDLLDWVQGGMGEDFVDYEALKANFKEDDPDRIGEISDALKGALDRVSSGEDPTAYLEYEEAFGYIIDMIFAQTYAQESRRLMAEAVLDAWLDEFYPLERWPDDDPERPDEDFVEYIESVHNYIDFEDQTIRKGACRAHEGERVIIPFNMKTGTLICRGKGDPDWNNSAPHGAGRAMSRTGAENKYDEDDFERQTEGVYTSKRPLDEIPGAYKDPDDIEEAIGPTVEIERRIEPLISIKAE